MLHIGVHAAVVCSHHASCVDCFQSFCKAAGKRSPATSADTAKYSHRLDVAAVQRGPIAHTLDVPAEFRPFQEIDVHAKMPATLRKSMWTWAITSTPVNFWRCWKFRNCRMKLRKRRGSEARGAGELFARRPISDARNQL